MNDPSPAELLRRIEETARSIERLTSTLEASYVRREVYEAKHEALRGALAADIKDVRDDVTDIKRTRQEDANRWKQAMFSLGLMLIGMLVTAAFAVSNFMARTGV